MNAMRFPGTTPPVRFPGKTETGGPVLRTHIDDVLTYVLTERGFPASQISPVALPIYTEALLRTREILARRKLNATITQIALALRNRRYAPPGVRRPRFESQAPASWRRSIPGSQSRYLAERRRISTGRTIRTPRMVIRGKRG